MPRSGGRRACPVRGPYQPDQKVMFWYKKSRANRLEAGRWCGPARVICQIGQSVVWLAFHDRVFRCCPESLRPASLREWQHDGTPLHQVLGESQLTGHQPPPVREVDEVIRLQAPPSDGVARQETERTQPESEAPIRSDDLMARNSDGLEVSTGAPPQVSEQAAPEPPSAEEVPVPEDAIHLCEDVGTCDFLNDHH